MIKKNRLKRGLNLCLTKFRSREKFKRKNSGDMGNQNHQLKIPRSSNLAFPSNLVVAKKLAIFLLPVWDIISTTIPLTATFFAIANRHKQELELIEDNDYELNRFSRFTDASAIESLIPNVNPQGRSWLSRCTILSYHICMSSLVLLLQLFISNQLIRESIFVTDLWWIQLTIGLLLFKSWNDWKNFQSETHYFMMTFHWTMVNGNPVPVIII